MFKLDLEKWSHCQHLDGSLKKEESFRNLWNGPGPWFWAISNPTRCCCESAALSIPEHWKTQQWPQDWKRSVFIPIPKKDSAKECSNYPTIALISHASKGREGKVAQSCLTLCDPIDCSLPGFSVHGIFQARVLEWVAISFSRGSSRPRDRTQVSRNVGRCFTHWATREAHNRMLLSY